MIIRPAARLAISSSVGWSGFWAWVGAARRRTKAKSNRGNRFTGNIFLWVHHTGSWGFGDFKFQISRTAKNRNTACLDWTRRVRACFCANWVALLVGCRRGRRRYLAWIAVIATAFTMSCVVQPLDRSLDGFDRPCRIGPIAVAFASRSTSL